MTAARPNPHPYAKQVEHGLTRARSCLRAARSGDAANYLRMARRYLSLDERGAETLRSRIEKIEKQLDAPTRSLMDGMGR